MIIHRLAMILLFAVLVMGLIMTGLWLQFFYTPVITDSAGYEYTVQPGASINSVIEDLYYKEVINSRFFFKVLVRIHGHANGLKAAEYRFPNGSKPADLLNQMYSGTGIVYHAFTLVPGWTFKEVRLAIAENPAIKQTLSDLSDQDVMAQLGYPALNPEGQFFPDTYYFTAGSLDTMILKRAFMMMQHKLNTAWSNRDPGVKLQSAEDALIVASLIEKEAYLNSERPVIASVIFNRLQKQMLLQIDPTVIYALGAQYSGKIHKDNLSISSPYNTYVNKGLPPTPIAMPSYSSLLAALHPAETDYLYFVARGDGSHQFSTNLSAHNAAVFSANHLPNAFFNIALVKKYLLKVL